MKNRQRRKGENSISVGRFYPLAIFFRSGSSVLAMMKPDKLSIVCVAACALLPACNFKNPSQLSDRANLALELRVVKHTLHEFEESSSLARPLATAAATRAEIYVIFEGDTLNHETALIDPETGEFSATLEVPAGEERVIMVEGWNDGASEEIPVLEYRGIEQHVRIEPEVEQTVAITLFPLAIPGRRVVMIAGAISGVAGSSENLLPVSLISADSVRGLQFELNFNAGLLSPARTVRDAALALGNLESNTVGESRALRVLLYDAAGGALRPQPEAVALMQVDFSVSPFAQAGDSSEVTFSGIDIRNSSNQPMPEVITIAGGVRIN